LIVAASRSTPPLATFNSPLAYHFGVAILPPVSC
jgi:hypothetical protein